MSLLTIGAMLALGYSGPKCGVRRHHGAGICEHRRAVSFFSPLLGWLGVALTGSERRPTCCSAACSRLPPRQVGVAPVLAAAANSAGG